MTIKDIQSSGDTRAVAINNVGIRSLKLPMLFCEDSVSRATVGDWSASTNLPADRRGTHMSRLVRVLHDNSGEFSFASFCTLPEILLQRLDASECFLSVVFTYFLEKTAPVSGEKGFIDATAMFRVWRTEKQTRRLLQVVAPVTTLCPCSKAISKYGAHNQRSHVTLTVEAAPNFLVRDLIGIADTSASAELFSVLKRSDERHVTEQAYDNPKFVEDIIRDLAVVLRRVPEIINYRIEAENFESIHNHSAYAIIQTDDFPTFLLR